MHLRTVFCLWFLVVPCLGQGPLTAVPAPAQRYLDILIKRPRPGTIFERFYAAWLEEGTAAGLGTFLKARADNADATAADHLLLAVYQSHRGDDRAALASYEAALKIDPGNTEAWIERSRLEARALDFATTLKSLDEAAKANPDATQAMEIGKLRGRALLRLGQNEEALKVWKDLAAAHADDEDLAEEMIDLLSDEGQYEAALEAGQALIKRSRDPVSKTLRQLRLADILLLSERRDEALKTLRDALAATGADTWIEGDVLGRMARVFRMGDDVSGLEKYLAALVVEHPQRVSLAWQHTQLLGETGQPEAALAQAQKLLQSNPGRRDLQEDFLDLLESLNLIKEAVAQAQVLVQQNSTDKELLVRLATLQHRSADDAGALTTLEGFLKVPGAGEADHLRVARLLENWEDPPASGKEGDPQSPAALAYARLVEKFPDSIAAHEAQAHYLHRTGHREAALAIWTRLAKTAALDDLLRIAQALQARLESRTALDLLMPREPDFPGDARFYALLVQLGIANKELERALPWALTRLRFSKDAEAIELAIKDVLLVLRGDEEGKRSAQLLQKLQVEAALTIQDRCLLATLLEESGKGADAEKTLTAAPDADRLIALNQLTQLFQTRQDWEKAAQALQQLIDLPDARTSARVQRMVDFYRRAMKREEALKWIAEWKKLSPSAVQPWLDESRLLLELNRPQDAQALLRDALRKFPDSTETASSYATLCLETGQPDEAERTYLALYEKTTDAAARLRLLGPMALAAQQHNALPRLIENFQQRQKQNRASAQPWMALAEIQRASGNDEERRRCLYEASRLRPQDLSLLLEIARSEEEVGLTAEALRTLDAAAKLDKTSKTREQIARLQIDSGDADAGYRMLFELAGGDQMDARGIEQMADTIAEKGEWERVITFLEPLLPKHPKDYRLHYLNAIALEEEGREQEAARSFLILLNLHEELPGVLNTGRSIGLRQQYAPRNLPPGAEDWLVLPSMMQYAYAHRQKAGRNSRSGYYSGYSSQQVNNGMPHGFIEHAPGVAESPVLALAHLLQIAGGWDVQERTALVPQLKRAGVSEAELLLEASEISPRLVVTPDMLAAHPQNVTLHAVWLMQNQSGDPEELLPVYENAWKLFETSDPVQARNIAQRAWAISGDQSAPWLERILHLVERMPPPEFDVFRSTAAMLQSQIAVREDASTLPRLAPAEVERLADLLLGWYRDKPDGCDPGSIVGALVAAKKWEGVFETLKIATAQPKPPTVPSAPTTQFRQRSAGAWGGQGYQSRMLQPQPLYTPPGFGVNINNLTSFIQGMNVYREDVQGAVEVPEAARAILMEMRDGLRPFITRADDPQLKFILRLFCGEEAAIESDIAVRLQAKDVTADDFLTAGWLSQRGNKHAEAFEHFTRALKLTTDENAKLPIENALLYHAQLLVQRERDEAKTASVRTQAKELLDAQLQKANSDDEKYQIAQLMAGVGYAAEAQSIQEAVQAARTRAVAPARQRNTPVANPYSSNRSYSQRQQQAQKTPEQLLKEGKTDLAVKELTLQLRSAIQQTISPRAGTGGHQQLHQVMNEAVKLKLWDDVAKVLREAANSGWRSHLQYAVMLEHVGNDSEIALTEHRAIIAANPRAYDSRIRLAVVLSYEGKFDEAAEHWRSVPVMLQEQYLPAIIQEFTQRHQFAIPHPEALSGLLCAWLKGLEPKRVLSMNMVQQFPQVLQYIQQADSTNNMRYPSLYEPWRGHFLTGDENRWKRTVAGGLDLSEASAKDRAMRRRAHDDLCRAMLQVPELSQLAFAPLAGVAQEEGDDPAALEPAALDLLTLLSMPKVKRRLAAAGFYNTNANTFSGRNRIAMPDAALFLVRAAARRNDTRALDESLYPLITRVHGKQRAAFLKGYAELLMAKDDGFPAAAGEWLKSQPAHAINNEGGPHDEVLSLWLERRITAPLDELFMPKSSAIYGYAIPHAVSAYAMTLGLRDPEAMKRFVRKVRNQWLGDDADARRKAVSDWVALQNEQQRRNSYFRQPGAREQAANGYIQWLQNLLQQSRGLAVLEIAIEDGLDASPGWVRQIAYRHINNGQQRTAAEFLKAAQTVGFLGDAAHLRAYDITRGDDRADTWLGQLARQFRERSDDSQVNAALELLGKQPRTFGTDLMQALLVKNSRTPLWLDGKPVPFEAGQVARFSSEGDDGKAHRSIALEIMLTRHAKDLAAMPEASQNELAVLLRGELSGYPQPERIGEALTLVLSSLLKAENLACLLQADYVIKARTFGDIGQAEYRFTQHFPTVLKDVARLDLPKAKAAARHAVELLQASPEQKQAEARKESETPVSRFLFTLAQVPELLPEVFEIADANGLTRSASWRSNLRSRLEQMAHHQDQATALFTHTPFVAEATAFRDLMDTDNNEPTIIAHIINAIENNDACAAAVREHLAQQPATFGTELLLAFLHRESSDDRYARSFYNSKRPDPAALLTFIQKRRTDFPRLQPGTAACLWKLLSARLTDLEKRSAEDATLQSALQPLVEADARHFEAEVTRWMQITSLHEAGVQEYEVTQQGPRLLDRLAQTEKPRAIALLDQISKLFAQQEALNQRGAQRPPHQTQVANWLQYAASVPELIGEVMQRADECGASKNPQWLGNLMARVRFIDRFRGSPHRVIALLDALGMLDVATTFDPRPLSPESQQRTLLESWIPELNRDDFRTFVTAELGKRQPRTFGIDLVLLLSKRPSNDEVADFASHHAEELGAISAEQQTILAQFFERMKWADVFAARVPALKERFAPILREQEARTLAFLGDLLQTRTWQDIETLYLKSRSPDGRVAPQNNMRPQPFYSQGQSSPAVDYLRTQLTSLSTTAPDKATQALLHLSSIYRAEFGQVNDPYRKPPVDNLLYGLCSVPRMVPAVLQFAAQNRSITGSYNSQNWSEYTLIGKTLDPVLSSAEKLTSTLAALGLLTKAETFDSVTLPAFSTRSMLGLVLWRISTLTPQMREQTAKLLIENKDATFGHFFFAAWLTAADSPEKIRRLDLCAATFARVRPQATGAILNAFESQFPALVSAEKAEGDLARFAPLLQLRTAEERAYLDAALAGKTNVAIPYRGYDLVVTQELGKLMNASRHDEALKLVQAMLRQLEPQNAAATFGLTSYRRDGERLSSFLGSMLRHDSADVPALFACMMLSATRLPEVRLLPDYLTPAGLTDIRGLLLETWEQRGGWAAPALVFDQLVKDIARHGIEHTRGLWFPLLHHMLARVGPLERGELMKWAIKQDKPGLKVVADEIRLALSLLDVTEPLLPTPGARVCASKKTKPFEDASKAARELLRDETIAPHVRLSLAAYFSAIFPGVLDETARQTWGLAAAQAWHDAKPITRFELESLLNSAAVLPINDTWSQTSALTLERWNQRETVSRQNKRRYIESWFHPFILRFAARSGDTKTLDWFVSQTGENDAKRFNGILLECGDWLHASKLNLLNYYDGSTAEDKWEWWLPPSEAALQVMKESGEKTILAEAMALNADDTATRILYPTASWPSREERLAALIKRLGTTPLPGLAVERAPALVVLGRENPAAALALLPQFDSISKTLLPDSFGEGSTGQRWWADFLAVQAALKFVKGDSTVAEASWKLVCGDGGNSSRIDSGTKGRFRSTLFRCLMRCWSSGMARDPEKLLKLSVLAATQKGEYEYETGGPSKVTLNACLGAWLAVLNQEALPAKSADKPVNISNANRTVALLSAICGTGRNRLSFQQRMQLFARVSGQTSLSQYQSQIWPLLMHQGIFTAEELEGGIEAVAQCSNALAPRHLENHALFLREHGSIKAAAKELEEGSRLLTAEFTKQAVLDAMVHKFQTSTDPSVVASVSMFPNSTPTGSSFLANRCLLIYTELLIRLGNGDGARDSLSKLNSKDKTISNLRRRDALLKLLPPVPAPAK